MNKFFLPIFTLLLSWSLQAQPNSNNCFDFQELPRDTSFGVDTGTPPGTIVFADNNYELRVDGFFFPDQNESEFYAASVLDNPFRMTPDVGRGLFLATVSVSFESLNETEDLKRVFFTIADGGGDKYLRINDEQTPFLSYWGELDDYIFEGGRIRVLQNDPDSLISTVILEGDIRSLSIGGNEQFLYEYCEQPLTTDFCRVSNLQIQRKECISENQYLASVDFEYEGIEADSFEVHIGDRSLGSYFLSDFPVELVVPFFPDQPTVEATVCVDGRIDCCSSVTFRQPFCNSCAITFAEVYPDTCDLSGQYMVDVYVEARNGSTTGFFIYDAFGREFGSFSYADSLVRIGPFSDLDDVVSTLTVVDAEEETCRFETEIPPSCPISNCVIEGVALEYQPCDDTGRFLLEVVVSATEGSAEGFFVNYAGQHFGPFSYQDSSITVGPILAGGELPIILEIIDGENFNCFWSDFLSPPCETTCGLVDAMLTPLPCDSSGAFFVEAFLFADIPGSELGVLVNGEFYGPFPPEDSLFVLGPFDGNIDAPFNWTVFDLEREFCFLEGQFESPCFENACENVALTATVLPCDNNEFNVRLAITDLTNSLEQFLVQVNNEVIYGPFVLPSSDTSSTVTIGPFSDALSVYNLTVFDVNDRSCRASIRVVAPDCAKQCSIQNFEVSIAEDCNEDSTFSLSYQFDINNSIGNGYNLLLDNQLIGRYPYGSNNLQFPNFSLDGRTSATLAIVAGGDFTCAVRQTIAAPECSVDTSQVWPGDTNQDGIANHFDLLNIGVGYGASGPRRTQQGTSWMALNATRWAESFPSGVNYKHADTDGSGFINDEDVNAIEQHYGLTTGSGDIDAPSTDPDEVTATEGDPSIFVDLPENGTFPVGSAFSVPIILGSEDRSVESVYGIAFTVNYDPSVIDANQLSITIPHSWMGDNLLTIYKEYPQEGKVEIAISRTDGESVTGYGVVALMTGIIVDLVGLRTVEVTVSKVRAINAEYTRIPIYPDSRSTTVTTTTQAITPEVVTVFPNPTDGRLRWSVPTSIITSIDILNIQGQVVRSLDTTQNGADISDLGEGIYLVRFGTALGYRYERIMKQ
jgi:hypothetical protein